MKLQTKINQQLIMNPQLQQAIKLLQMSRFEMEQFIEKNLLENPVLEGEENKVEEFMQENQEIANQAENDFLEASDADYDYDSYNTEYDMPLAKNKETNFNENQNFLETTISKEKTLAESLVEQIGFKNYNEVEANILYYLANNLYENGYLCGSLIELLASNKEACEQIKLLYKKYPIEENFDLEIGKFVYEKKFRNNNNQQNDFDKIPVHSIYIANKILSFLQEMDPVGCGSRSLQECLSVQAKKKYQKVSREYKILHYYWNFFIAKKYKKIARRLGVSIEIIEDSVKKIQTLNPYPGSQFSFNSTDFIVPDVFLIMQDGKFKIKLNNKYKKVHINPYYKNIIKDYRKKKIYQADITYDDEISKRYILEKVRAGEWLLKNIEQRQETIRKVAESIIKKQKKFFQYGKEYLKPMVLKDIADDIGMHESTVSRITNKKYIKTSQGVFELKYFFSSGIEQEGGEIVSSLRIKEYIQEIIDKEDIKKPFTDNYIVLEIAREHNIKLARRTIAKYREALKIPSSSKRKIC